MSRQVFLQTSRGARGTVFGAAFLVVIAVCLVIVPSPDGEVVRRSMGYNQGHLLGLDDVTAVNGSMDVSTSHAYGGQFGGQAEYFGGSSGGYARGAFDVAWESGDDVWYGMAVFLPSGFYSQQTRDISVMRWDNYPTYGGSSETGGITIRADHRAQFEIAKADGSAESVLVGPFDIPEETWVHLEVHQRLGNGGNALTEVYRDGELIGSSPAANTFGRGVDRLSYGMVWSPPQEPLKLYFDRTTVREAQFGPIPNRGSSPLPPDPTPIAPLSDRWKLIFRDEFDVGLLDDARWATCFAYSANTCPHGNELQLYNPDDVYVANGALRMRAQKRDMPRGRLFRYTSGMAATGGQPGGLPGFTFTYGFAEARVKMPQGQGLWPAFWLRPWPPGADPAEIDVFEVLGHDTNRAHFHVHHWGGAPGATYDGPDFSADWHTFAVDWQPDKIVWYVDGVERWRYSGPGIPDMAMYVLLNLAVGGDWPGPPDSSTVFPSHFDVDYVRVWQRL